MSWLAGVFGGLIVTGALDTGTKFPPGTRVPALAVGAVLIVTAMVVNLLSEESE